ncbi:MAG: hypothetical protein J0I28_07995 [Caulobacterales bacterium]|nr:hypothetical protein [Caulobacterales bacterium]
MSDNEQETGWEAQASHWLSVGMMLLVGVVMMGFGIYSLLHGIKVLGQDANPAQAGTGVVVAGFGLLLARWAWKRAKTKSNPS